jgi:hypothetical protein
MATKNQYEVFKSSYDEELSRYSALGTRSSLYLSVITFFLGAIAFKIEDVQKFMSQFGVPMTLYFFIGLALLGGLLCTVLAVRVRSYEGVFDPVETIESFGDNPPTDEEFFDDRIIDFAVATKCNATLNNRVANVLQWATYFLVAAVSLQLIIFLWAVMHLLTRG